MSTWKLTIDFKSEENRLWCVSPLTQRDVWKKCGSPDARGLFCHTAKDTLKGKNKSIWSTENMLFLYVSLHNMFSKS